MPVPARPIPPRRLHWPLLFGYDFFISFKLGPASAGGSQGYAADLARKLGALGYLVYFCEKEAVPGDPLWNSVMAALRRSKALVVLANDGALLKSTFVRREVEAYRQQHPKRRVIVVDVDDAVARHGAQVDAPAWLTRNDPVRLNESTASVERSQVPLTTVNAIAGAARHVRARALIRASVATVLAVVSLLAVAASYQAWIAGARLRDSQLLTVRLLSRDAKFDEAYAIAGRMSPSDPGARLAATIAKQHRSWEARDLPLPASAGQGVFGLALTPDGRTLFAMTYTTLVAVDTRSGAALSMSAKEDELYQSVSTIASVGDGERIVAYGPEQLRVCSASGRRIGCTVATLERPTSDIAWFAGTPYGLAVSDGRAFALALDSDRVGFRDLGMAGLRLNRSRDGTATGIFVENGKLAAMATVGSNGIAVAEPARALATGTLSGGATFASVDGRRLLWSADGEQLGSAPGGSIIERLGELLFVQRHYDRTMDTGSRFHVVDPTAGSEMLSPFAVREPVWSYALDPHTGDLYLGGQSGPITVVGTRSPRVLVRRTAGIEPPIVARPLDFLIRVNWLLERTFFRVRAAGSLDLALHHASPEVGKDDHALDVHWMAYQDFPFSGALSPDGQWLAANGNVLRLLRVPAGLVRTAENLEGLAQRSLDDEQLITRSLGDEALERVRWVGNTRFVTDDRHQKVTLWDVDSPEPQVLELSGDAATTISMQGPVLISTLSGNVWTLDERGSPSLYAAIPEAVHVFPLDDAGTYFVAHMRDPDRTGFLARRGSRIDEVYSVPTESVLRDAAVAGDNLLLMYEGSLRAYDLSGLR